MNEVIDISEDAVVVEKEPVVEEKKVPDIRTAELSELEYNSISKILGTVQSLKTTLKENSNQAVMDQINFLEVSIWDDIVKKFGFESVEAARGSGYSFGLKKVHIVECRKR
jgi:hypothetical protein